MKCKRQGHTVENQNAELVEIKNNFEVSSLCAGWK